MGNEVIAFNVGLFNCFAIRDGDDWNRNVLLVNTGQHHVVIETGNGDTTSPPGLLLDRLQAAGVSPAEIDVVILSHADADHIAGAADASGKLAFPEARYVLSREEWAFWLTKPERLRPSAFFDAAFHQWVCEVPGVRLAQLRETLELIEAETEIVPGIHAIAAPGHTPGHTVIVVSSGDEQLLFLADVIYSHDLNDDAMDTPKDIGNPEWHAVVDVDPAQAIVTRDRLFEQAARERTLLLAYHLPFPGLGFVSPHGQGWRWQPPKTTD